MNMRSLIRSLYGVSGGGLAFLLFIGIRPGCAETRPSLSARLEMIWSTPITVEMKPDGTFGRSQGLVLYKGAMTPGENVMFLGDMNGGQHPGRVLLRNAERAGLDDALHLDMSAPDTSGSMLAGMWFFKKQNPNRDPTVLNFIQEADGQAWLGGFSNAYMGLASDYNRDPYLAKMDQTGRRIWERSYRTGRELTITSIVPATAGGVVGVGIDMRVSWLARIAEDGTLLKEYGFGNGIGAEVVRLSGDRFLVVGFDSEGQAATYQDNLSTWLLDASGVLHGPVRIREALNNVIGSHYGYVTASAVSDGAYVASNWRDPFHPQEVEVARVGPEGALLWRQMLSDTVRAQQGRKTSFSICDPALTTLVGGDALVACAMGEEIQLYRFDSSTGEQKVTQLPLPDCQRNHPANLFLMVRHDGAVIMGGSRPASNVAGSCSWLARLIL